MVTLDTLQRWLVAPAENEHLEFKEAKQQFDTTRLLRYCAALANEGGGYMVLGVTDKPPRRVVGSRAFASLVDLNRIKAYIVEKLGVRVEVIELPHPDGRVLAFEVPARPVGHPLDFEGAYLMRAGEDLVPMTPDQLRRIFAEGQADWFSQPAKLHASADQVIALLDTQTYFDLSKLPYPTSRDGVLAKLSGEELIEQTTEGWMITNLAAILLAKRLDAFSPALARKAPRVVIYEGIDKSNTREDKTGQPWLCRGVWKPGGFCAFGSAAKPFCGASGTRGSKNVSEEALWS